MTGIHPVSIRKYEINKMQPQLEQIERIAQALRVNANALIGFDNLPTRVHTIGDLLGILMMCHRSGLMYLDAPRSPSTNRLNIDYIRLIPNPALKPIISIALHRPVIDQEICIGDFDVVLKDPQVLVLMISWEREYFYTQTLLETKKGSRPCGSRGA